MATATEQDQHEQQAEDADESTAGEQQQDQGAQGDGSGEADQKDWEAEYKAQQRINRDLERRSKSALKKLEQQLADAKNAKSDGEGDAKPDVEAIRKQVRDEVTSEGLRERALDKIETKAARQFANPEDARTFLAARVDEFVSDGKVDLDAIGDALADLLKDRPYLAAAQGDGKRFNGTGDGGARGTAGKPQLTKQDVERLSKEGKYEEIETARKEGRLNDILGIKTST